MSSSVEVNGLVVVAGWISSLLVTGAGLCCAIVVLRIHGKTEFNFSQLAFPLRKLPWVLFALTIAHAYLTWLLHIKVDALLAAGGSFPMDAWRSLVGESSAIAFNGMKQRMLVESWSIFGAVYATELSDPTFWLNAAFAFSVVVSVLVSRAPDKVISKASIWRMDTLDSLMIGVVLASANWLLGSHWAIRLSELAK